MEQKSWARWNFDKIPERMFTNSVDSVSDLTDLTGNVRIARSYSYGYFSGHRPRLTFGSNGEKKRIEPENIYVTRDPDLFPLPLDKNMSLLLKEKGVFFFNRIDMPNRVCVAIDYGKEDEGITALYKAVHNYWQEGVKLVCRICGMEMSDTHTCSNQNWPFDQ